MGVSGAIKARTRSFEDEQKQKIVIIIDDIDRLEGKEIFEVLRIIRNTAKFNNIIYIVAYDKDHVVGQLCLPEFGIEKDYLEKMAPIKEWFAIKSSPSGKISSKL